MISKSSLIQSRRLLVIFLVTIFVVSSSLFLKAEKRDEKGDLGVHVTALSQDEKEDQEALKKRGDWVSDKDADDEKAPRYGAAAAETRALGARPMPPALGIQTTSVLLR